MPLKARILPCDGLRACSGKVVLALYLPVPTSAARQASRASCVEASSIALFLQVGRPRVSRCPSRLSAIVISFTAGVGENAAPVRAAALETLGFAGVVLDPDRNATPERGIRVISADASAVTVLVVPTDEELEIARQTLDVAHA